jgi:hypothetical protein
MSPTSKHGVKELRSLPPDKQQKVKSAALAAHAPSPATPPGYHPGVERWPVKTGTDADVGKVGTNTVNKEHLGTGFVQTTVEEMRSFPRASNMPPVHDTFTENSFYQDRRAVPTETTIWKLTATVTEGRIEQDGDYHLVLTGDSGNTMIGEIPMPETSFVAASSPWFNDIKAARAAMDLKLKQLGKSLEPVGFTRESMAPPSAPRPAGAVKKEKESDMTPIGARAVITGVGFFDSAHGQTGVAPTAIEIHPILDIEFQD